MEHNHGGLVQIIFHSKWMICRFHVNLPGCKFFMFTKRRQHGEKIHSWRCGFCHSSSGYWSRDFRLTEAYHSRPLVVAEAILLLILNTQVRGHFFLLLKHLCWTRKLYHRVPKKVVVWIKENTYLQFLVVHLQSPMWPNCGIFVAVAPSVGFMLGCVYPIFGNGQNTTKERMIWFGDFQRSAI